MNRCTTIQMLKDITEKDIYKNYNVYVRYINDVLCCSTSIDKEYTPIKLTKDIIDNWKWVKANNETTWDRAVKEHIKNNKTIEFFGSNGYELVNTIYKPYDRIILKSYMFDGRWTILD